MFYTVSDLMNSFQPDVTLIAGSGGLSREIASAGILDYELVSELKNKYFHTNFHEYQFVMTTFLYTKDNPFLINDAVKHLIAKGASGLLIKNVFHLQIPETALRYADSKNFPILITTTQHIFFEDVIYNVNRHIEQLKETDFSIHEIDILLNQDLSETSTKYHVNLINPSFEEQYFAIYLECGDFFDRLQFIKYSRQYTQSKLYRPSNRLLFHNRGIFYICSSEQITTEYKDENIQYILNALFPDNKSAIGISDVHFTLNEFADCLKESMYAALMNRSDLYSYRRFVDLGTYKLIFSLCKTNEMKKFCESTLDPVKTYDIENNSCLMETLNAYVDSSFDFSATAKMLAQHVNTIRYRLDKISSITNLSYKIPKQMEQLTIAVQIDICRNLLLSF